MSQPIDLIPLLLVTVFAAYVLLYVGHILPSPEWVRVHDVSYGMYIYGWPVQQLLALVTFGTGMPVGWFIALSLVLTVPLAFLSCAFVERPALARKRGSVARMFKPAPLT